MNRELLTAAAEGLAAGDTLAARTHLCRWLLVSSSDEKGKPVPPTPVHTVVDMALESLLQGATQKSLLLVRTLIP